MLSNRKELYYLIFLAIISFSFSLLIGFQYVYPDKVTVIDKLENVKARPIISSLNFKQVGSNEIIFSNGYAFQHSHKQFFSGISSFYNGDISLQRTSIYWKFPAHDKKSELVLRPNRTIQLIIDDKLLLPVVSLIVEPQDFFSYENGIYVEGMDADFHTAPKFYPMAWHKPANFYRKNGDKRKVHFTFYNKEGEAEYSTMALAEVSGNATRCFPQKSLRISASRDLGDKIMKYDFFSEKKMYKSIVLRNGGNDNTKSLFRDKLMQSLMKKSGILVSGYVACEVYLNGEYWGIHFIQNRVDDNFIAEKFNVKEKDVTIVEDWKLADGSEKEFNELKRLVSPNNKSLSFETIESIIDMDDFIPYLIGEIYFGNTDWPENNLKMYKISGKIAESRWKFAFFDLDYGFGYTGIDAVELDMFAHLNGKKDPLSRIFQVCMKNKEFRIRMRESMEAFMKTELAEKEMIIQIKNNVNELEGAIPNHTARWQNPSDLRDWKGEVVALISFAENRNRVIKEQIAAYLR